MNEHLIAHFRKQLEDDPKSRVFIRLAEEYRKGGEHESAAAVCRTGLEVHPNYVPALVCLGRCLFQLKDLDGAEDAFRKVLALNSDNPHALRGLGDICEASGRNSEALVFFETVLIHDPGNELILEKVGSLKAAPPEEPAEVELEDVDDIRDSEEELVVEDQPAPPVEPVVDEIHFDLADDTLPPEEPVDETLPPDELILEDETAPVPPAPPIETDDDDVDITFDLIDEAETGPFSEAMMDEAATEPVEDVSTEPIGTPLNEASTAPMESSVMDEAVTEPLEIHPDDSDDDAVDQKETTAPARSEPLDQAPEDDEPIELDEIDLEFEKAMSDEQAPQLFEAEELDEVAQPEPVASAPTASIQQTGLKMEDETSLTLGLKHERLEHYEETRSIYKGLLDRYPGNPTVTRHLERVNRILLREGNKARKIRHLSNWLDKIKGVYHVS